jgi:hypothetical protein
VYLAYVLLVFSAAFFGGMAALIMQRSRQEAKKIQDQKHSADAEDSFGAD